MRMNPARRIGIVAVSTEGAARCYRIICLERTELLGPYAHPVIAHEPGIRSTWLRVNAPRAAAQFGRMNIWESGTGARAKSLHGPSVGAVAASRGTLREPARRDLIGEAHAVVVHGPRPMIDGHVAELAAATPARESQP